MNKIEFPLDNSGRMIYAEATDRGISFVVGFQYSTIVGRSISYKEARELMQWIERQLFARKIPLSE